MAVGQVLLLACVLGAYRLGRYWSEGDATQAVANAHEVWDLQKAFHLPDEASFQEWALRWDAWVPWANRFYVGVHFPVTGAFLVWIYLRHRPVWPRVRAAIILSLVLALAVHAVYPLAPPRLVPEFDMVDLMTVYGPSAYAEQPGEGMNNQFAAMPSLHVGWAVLVAWGVIRYGRGWVRWLVIAHPVVTTLVVVLTANHYWLDGIIGTGVVAVCLVATGRLERQPGEIASGYDQRGTRAGREPVRRAAR